MRRVIWPVQYTSKKDRLTDKSNWIASLPRVYNVNKQWSPWRVGPRESQLKRLPGQGKEWEGQILQWTGKMRRDEPTQY